MDRCNQPVDMLKAEFCKNIPSAEIKPRIEANISNRPFLVRGLPVG